MYPNIEILEQKKTWIESIGTSFLSGQVKQETSGMLWHYTSLPTLFDILQSDTIWATATRFSNDSSEEQIFPAASYLKQAGIRMDNFQFCVSQNKDCLSQWRGYCPEGGGAIELDMKRPGFYSVLHADHDVSGLYEVVENAPLSVLYVPKVKQLPEVIMQELKLKEKRPDALLKAYNMIPYFKHAAFKEEAEWRLLFENTNNEYSKCVRFRTLRNGAKVPYLVVKFGDNGKNGSHCAFDEKAFDDEEKLLKVCEERNEIVIPQGNDQETVYYGLKARILAYNREKKEDEQIAPWIRCEGHLPIRRIILSPTYDRMRLKEEVQRFCASRYWLQDVKVECSEIPYIPPSE